ncbi:MAG TPA: competence/damage-inducible protein A, partial [Longimicrobiales bacterium]|nr:competence/damage-inducible protein A [Longimicrobiales bacterium]
MLRAAVVAVGDELLNGETVDTNAAWLGRRLAALGLPVWYRHTVGDEDDDIRAAVGAAARDADLVVVSGGLGPTGDDRTREAVATLYGRALEPDPRLLEELQSRFRKLGYETMPEANRSQTLVPRGARVLPNGLGTAPGLLLDEEDTLVVLLPGVPRELRNLFDEELAPLLSERFGHRLSPVAHRVLHTTGIAESRLSELVEAALPDDMGPVRVAFLPDLLGVDLRLTASGVPPTEAKAHLDRVEAALSSAVEPWRFESPSGDLAEALATALRARGATLSVAESCTGGLVAERMARIPGVSDVLLGGVVAYANVVKEQVLSVPAAAIRRHGAVSEEVATAMARGVAELCGSDLGIGVTGIAGPGGGTEEKPVGTVWTAVSYGGQVTARHRRFPGDRAQIQARAAQDALRMAFVLARDGHPA